MDSKGRMTWWKAVLDGLAVPFLWWWKPFRDRVGFNWRKDND